jgi:phage gp36-like protein
MSMETDEHVIIRSADDLIEALRSRKVELSLSNEAIEQELLWASGMADKYLGPSRTKPLTSNNIENLLTLFGCELVLRPNPEARMRDLERRDERQVRPQRRFSKGLLALARAQIFKELSARGNEARRAKVSPKARSRIARAAATCRWKHRRASTSEGAQA